MEHEIWSLEPKELDAMAYTCNSCNGAAETGDSNQSCQIEVVSSRFSEETLP